MSKLYLKFDEQIIREIVLSAGVITIGRQPDNLIQIDNPAVSGHHAKIYWDGDHYVLEDTDSFNGTYRNNHRTNKAVLKDRDVILIGKHTIEFDAQPNQDRYAHKGAVDRITDSKNGPGTAHPPQLDPTVVLDTRKAKEMLAKVAAMASAATAGHQMHDSVGIPSEINLAQRRRSMGTLTVLDGKTDREHYVLLSKLTVIGRSALATIRLKRWFAPRIAASIQQRDDVYFIVSAGKKSKIWVNKLEVTDGKRALNAGDVVEVAGMIASFDYEV